jgi:hypothetical protein
MKTFTNFGLSSTPTSFLHKTNNRYFIHAPRSFNNNSYNKQESNYKFKNASFFKSQNQFRRTLTSPSNQKSILHTPITSQKPKIILPLLSETKPIQQRPSNTTPSANKRTPLNTYKNVTKYSSSPIVPKTLFQPHSEIDKLINEYYFLYQPATHSKNSFDVIKGYGTNTYRGIVRNYNEDRVSVIINAKCPFTGEKNWPNVSFFGIYDGHAGNKCAEYLKNNLHNLLFKNQHFPEKPIQAIEETFIDIEKNFTSMSSKNKSTIDYSGSCAVIILIINTTCYAINLGDSRAIYSSDGGNRLYQLTRDHKPNDSLEYKRIVQGGGSIYQTPGIGLGITLPYRIIPGKLSVNIFYN